MNATLDSIRTELAAASKRLDEAKQRQRASQQEVAECAKRVKQINELLTNGGRFELKVSDHALLRYAERVLGFDPQEVARVIAEKVEPAAYLLGDCTVPISENCVAVVQGKVVVTIKYSKP